MPVVGNLGHPEIVVIGQESLAKMLRVWEDRKDEEGEIVRWDTLRHRLLGVDWLGVTPKRGQAMQWEKESTVKLIVWPCGLFFILTCTCQLGNSQFVLFAYLLSNKFYQTLLTISDNPVDRAVYRCFA